MRWSKIPVQELWLKMGGGRIREGGRNSGILRYMFYVRNDLGSRAQTLHCVNAQH